MKEALEKFEKMVEAAPEDCIVKDIYRLEKGELRLTFTPKKIENE